MLALGELSTLLSFFVEHKDKDINARKIKCLTTKTALKTNRRSLKQSVKPMVKAVKK